jgi:hypothetical protein
MRAAVTTSSAVVRAGTPFTKLLILQNQNTDADIFLGWGGTDVSAADDATAGIMLARAESATKPTTMMIGGENLIPVASADLKALHNGSGTKYLTIQAIN